LQQLFAQSADSKAIDGFGDFSTVVKYRITSANLENGAYSVAASLTTTFPTGSYQNGVRARRSHAAHCGFFAASPILLDTGENQSANLLLKVVQFRKLYNLLGGLSVRFQRESQSVGMRLVSLLCILLISGLAIAQAVHVHSSDSNLPNHSCTVCSAVHNASQAETVFLFRPAPDDFATIAVRAHLIRSFRIVPSLFIRPPPPAV
jgi:hypothetical protein